MKLPEGVRMSDLWAKMKTNRGSSFERREFKTERLADVPPPQTINEADWDTEVPF